MDWCEQLLTFFPGHRPMSIPCGVDKKIIQPKQVAIDIYHSAVFRVGYEGVQADCLYLIGSKLMYLFVSVNNKVQSTDER